LAGKWGHNPLPWATENERRRRYRCYCGKFGCIEGAGLAREYFSLSQKQLLAEQITEAEQSGEPDAVQSLAAYQNRLGRSLAALVNVLDPDVIVLGGGISNINSLYDGLTELIGQHAFSDGIKTKVVRAAHGDSSGVRGAAWLWPINKH
jgi:fructokinase